LGPIPNPQSPKPQTQYPKVKNYIYFFKNKKKIFINI